jgi:hypothetical protein
MAVRNELVVFDDLSGRPREGARRKLSYGLQAGGQRDPTTPLEGAKHDRIVVLTLDLRLENIIREPA